jgi:hypothetical protein
MLVTAQPFLPLRFSFVTIPLSSFCIPLVRTLSVMIAYSGVVFSLLRSSGMEKLLRHADDGYVL